MKVRTELEKHLNETVTLEGKFAHYDKVRKCLTFKKLVNIETGEKTDHINLFMKPNQKFDKNKTYQITGVVIMYHYKDNPEQFNFGLKSVTIKVK